jgi:hypothetical protein
MVGIAAAIAARFPHSVSLVDWGVLFNGTADEIYHWDTDAMGYPMPSEADLAEWMALPAPPAPPDWIEYREGLRDPCYVSIVAAALSSTPEAKYGAMNISAALNSFQDRGDHKDYLDCIVWILGGSTLPVAEKTDLAAKLLALMTRCNLPSQFITEFIEALDSLSSP